MPMVGSTVYVTCLTKEKTMTKITTLDLSPFYRNSIGVDKLFDRMMHQIDTATASTTNYPPYNIVKVDEENFQIELAVAGFNKKEISISKEKERRGLNVVSILV